MKNYNECEIKNPKDIRLDDILELYTDEEELNWLDGFEDETENKANNNWET